CARALCRPRPPSSCAAPPSRDGIEHWGNCRRVRIREHLLLFASIQEIHGTRALALPFPFSLEVNMGQVSFPIQDAAVLFKAVILVSDGAAVRGDIDGG